ncbi:MAG: DUF4010 domain-containing protein [Bacteroidota bacterium]|nr:DUF4010 domain-containing protein [Bacteroidota bacterium]
MNDSVKVLQSVLDSAKLPAMEDSIKHLNTIVDSLKNSYLFPVLPSVYTSTDGIISFFQRLGVAIFIGALIGLEREHSRPLNKKTFAGLRTFTLMSIFGFTSAFLSSITSIWIYFAIFLGFSALVTSAHILSSKEGRMGGTSEISTFLVFILGSLVFWKYLMLSSAIAVIITLFLSLKIQLHKFAGEINEEDIFAALKLAIITLIVLPLLPDKAYGPLNILNPRQIWYMVIFISGIGFIGYVLIKLIGKTRGNAISGLLGGLVSSTAVTFSFARKSKLNSDLSSSLSLGILLASALSFFRMFVIILVVNSLILKVMWLPLSILAATGFIVSFFIAEKIKRTEQQQLNIKNPFEITSALLFGLIFAIIIFLVKGAQVYFGSSGVFLISGLGGIISPDAIIISLAKLSGMGITAATAAAAVIIASITNDIFKCCLVLFLGSKVLIKNVLLGLGIIIFVSLICLFFII